MSKRAVLWHASNPIGGQVRYSWVNQNQTYRHEVEGGYLWSPKRSASGARNPFYESMREVSPGDLIFSFMDTRIQAVGIAESYCWESPKPLEFGTAGQNWENIGWKVKVAFTALATKIRPKDHIDISGRSSPSDAHPCSRMEMASSRSISPKSR
jgi:putative restriction endonuclease